MVSRRQDVKPDNFGHSYTRPMLHQTIDATCGVISTCPRKERQHFLDKQATLAGHKEELHHDQVVFVLLDPQAMFEHPDSVLSKRSVWSYCD